VKVSNLGKYLPDSVTEIVSGGAKGIDTCAKEYALHYWGAFYFVPVFLAPKTIYREIPSSRI
jgi:predicted Rossmann fold nucleotide-binding protein DprA/Smf involved in DNA uptake